MSRFHDLTHRHQSMSKEGLGVFRICESRWPLGRAWVNYQPDGSDRLYLVPSEYDAFGISLLVKMIHAEDPAEALKILRTSEEYG